jgi:tetratricopeptide (TPR) repeat protein
MKLDYLAKLCLVIGLAGSAGLAAADPVEEGLRPILAEWAVIKYRTPEKQQEARYHALAQEAHKLAEANPGRAEPLVWEGIALSSEAGAKGGLGALSLARAAKEKLELALKENDHALKGSAWTSLGTLYYKVPGWPIGFGDKARAEEMLNKALAMNPDGIDPNFFHGEYLYERKRYGEALKALEAAMKAPARPGRELADSGRHQEILALMAKVRKDMEN